MTSHTDLQSDPQVAAFLKHACRWIFSAKKKENVRLELLFHIEESVQNKCEQCVALELAVSEVLLAMGPPNELFRKLGYANRPLVFHWPFLAASVVGLILIGVIYCVESISNSFDEAAVQQAKIVNKHLERFLADEKSLSADPLFDFPGQLHDAGPKLNSLVEWSWSGDGFKKYFPVSSLSVSEGIKRELTKSYWLKSKVDVSTFDTRRMAELSNFDHWNVFDSGPLEKIFADNPSQNFWSLPIPDYMNLQVGREFGCSKGCKREI